MFCYHRTNPVFFCGKEWETFGEAFHMVKIFLQIWDEHTDIYFAEIKGF
jgi:hypothetical protein